MPNTRKKGYSARDLRDVSDSPELTKEDFARARPFAEAFLNWRRRSEKAAARTRCLPRNWYLSVVRSGD